MADEPVLIALSIDGVLALYRQRALVREAHAAIAQEIDANLSDLEGALPALDAHDRHLEQALRLPTICSAPERPTSTSSGSR